MNHFPRAAEVALERLLPQLLLRMQEPREATKSLAQAALGAIRAAYPSEQMLHVLMRVLDVPTARVRIGALGMVSACAGSAHVYLNSAQHMRPCVQKALPFLSDKNAELKSAALSAMRALHEAGGPSFVQQVASLPLPTQNALKAVMRDANLDASLAALNRPPRPQSVRSATEAPPPPPSHPPPNEMADDALHNTGHISPRMRTQHPPRGGAPAASGYTRPVEEDRTAPPPDPALRPVQRPLPPHQQAARNLNPSLILISIHASSPTSTRASSHTSTHTPTHTSAHTSTHTSTHTSAHTSAHTSTHTHPHTHLHTHLRRSRSHVSKLHLQPEQQRRLHLHLHPHPASIRSRCLLACRRMLQSSHPSRCCPSSLRIGPL